MSSDGVYLLYHYNPSSAAAIIFIVLFGISAIFHIYQLSAKRTWYFIPFIIGGLFEFIGYLGRYMNSRQAYAKWTLGPYLLQSLFILLAPAFFAASIYMVLGRIILLTDGEQYSLIRARWLTKIFVTGDVLSFLMQSSGGGILATAKTVSTTDMGNHIITGGLVVQVLFFAFFIVTAGVFHFRIKKENGGSVASAVPWQQYLMILYLASTFIMIRSLFRIAEYVQGTDGSLLSTETYIYIFDATLMFIVMVIFNVRHPSAIIQGKGQQYHVAAPTGSRDGYAMEDRTASASKYHNRQYTREEV
ncbi:c2c8fc5d-42c5-4a6d-9e79-da2db35c54fa [Sclerotinia trifoliorum]|uniref:C2c8fc5d-42c5-4a6d-9e79-da2db35c54fa n=1 Tax=Sclerotinia trifoliorum TaxID=28548 RepID=A0A8H2ZLR0_9HELO|nr:c2c8fc5d-42c5-4a6d-9e79-da2db35c54fa [Sclerotinia trifoliorum]